MGLFSPEVNTALNQQMLFQEQNNKTKQKIINQNADKNIFCMVYKALGLHPFNINKDKQRTPSFSNLPKITSNLTEKLYK